MNPYLLIVALGLAALIETSLLPAISVAGVAPNLMLVVVVAWTINRNTREALLWAVIGGLWLDLLSSSPFGSYTLGLLAATYVAGLGSRTVNRNNLLLPFVMLVAATIIYDGVRLLLLMVMGYTPPEPSALLRILVYELAMNALLMVVVYPLLAWLDRLTGRERLPLE